MCAVVFYRKLVRGRLYPVKARTGPYAFANEVTRVGSKIASKYVGIVKVPEGKKVDVPERRLGKEPIETKSGTDVVEAEAEEDVVETGSRTRPANANRFSGRFSDFRKSQTDSETRFLSTANYYGGHLERNVLALDWSTVRCESCGHEVEETSEARLPFARALSEVALECPSCGKTALIPKAYLPDLVASRRMKLVIEIYGEKSSVKDAAKMGFYRANGFTAVTVPNAVADDAECSKPIFQLLALTCGSDHPERLYAPEIG